MVKEKKRDEETTRPDKEKPEGGKKKKERVGGSGGREGGAPSLILTLGCSKQAGQFSLMMGRRLEVAKALVSPSRV